MTNDEIKADIIEACAIFVGAGFELIASEYCKFSRDSKLDKAKPCGGCALTAVMFARSGGLPDGHVGHAVEVFARARYRWSSDDISAFVNGFDRERHYADYAAYALGRAVRAAVLP